MSSGQNSVQALDENMKKISITTASLAKEERKRTAEVKRAEHAAQKEAQDVAQDDCTHLYGNLPITGSSLVTASVISLDQLVNKTSDFLDKEIKVRAYLQHTRATSSKLAFLTLRQGLYTIQAVSFQGAPCSKAMIKFITGTSKESLVQIQGKLKAAHVDATTLKSAELSIEQFWVVSLATTHPFDLEDATKGLISEVAQSNEVILGTTPTTKTVLLQTRLDNRVYDLRTITNQAIFRLQHSISKLFREFLESRDFVEIHTPKLISAASEGGANVFKVNYFEKSAFLAQSPQFYKQMMIVAGMERVFEIAPVFRAENSFTHRHMTEFTGLDVEMVFLEHYHEVMLLLARLLMHIFRELPKRHGTELALVRAQYPTVEDFCFSDEPLILKYPEAMAMLRADGVQIGDHDDMGTEQEKHLGRLVKTTHGTDFFILDKFPLAVRPFYTMPDPEMPGYANAYDFFMRGEEIMSGAQRVHHADMLEERAKSLSIDTSGMKSYIDSFRYGASPHAGGGIGLERVLMFYLGLKNIRLATLFPRDPVRLTP